MTKFRKKPVVIDAIRWMGGNSNELDKFCGLNWARANAHEVAWGAEDDGEQLIVWNQLEGQWLCAPVGHWIIRGTKGELYPCENEVFETSYEIVIVLEET